MGAHASVPFSMPVHVHVLLPCVSLLNCTIGRPIFFHLFINTCMLRPAWLKLEPVHFYRIISVFMHLQDTWFLASRAPCIH